MQVFIRTVYKKNYFHDEKEENLNIRLFVSRFEVWCTEYVFYFHQILGLENVSNLE